MSGQAEDNRRSLGRRGEEIAADYLRRRGYRILEANYRCRTGEIDIVAAEKGVLVFVEVRTRQGSQYGTPEESITPRKQHKLRQVAEAYLEQRYLACEASAAADRRSRGFPVAKKGDVPACRIDAVLIAMDANLLVQRIDLIRGAVVN